MVTRTPWWLYACGTVKFDVEPAWHCELLQKWKERFGLRGFKIRVGHSKAWDEAFAREARQTVGPDSKLMIDAYMTYSAETAAEMARRFAPYEPYFLEEPLPGEDYGALARLTRSSHIPIALGERVSTLFGFQQLLTNGVGNIFQPDVTIAGGMAEAFSVRCMPHIGGLTAVGIAANLHLALAHPNAKLLEVDPWEYQPLRDELLREPIFDLINLQDGKMPAPQKPGLGIDIDESVLAKYPFEPGTPMYPEDYFHNYGAGRL